MGIFLSKALSDQPNDPLQTQCFAMFSSLRSDSHFLRKYNKLASETLPTRPALILWGLGAVPRVAHGTIVSMATPQQGFSWWEEKQMQMDCCCSSLL